MSAIRDDGSGREPCRVVSCWQNLGRWMKYPCKHTGARKFRLLLYGRLSRLFSGDALCPECLLLKEMHIAIDCATCGKKIVRGDIVAHLFPSEKTRPEAVRTSDGKVVACSECSEFDGYTGRWTESGTDLTYPLETLWVP